ncbi:hypothetical protein OEZ86_003916 [Tetradesmus obliquus]|nr:hypothetical protein OEZ86_003916 [Tetradesmus obliquus]
MLYCRQGQPREKAAARERDLQQGVLCFYAAADLDEALSAVCEAAAFRLAHPWLAALHDDSDEPVAEQPFAFDVPGQLRPDDAAELMWKEVLRFHPELAALQWLRLRRFTLGLLISLTSVFIPSVQTVAY